MELALLTPFLLLLVLGAIDLGRAYYATIAISNAAYNGAQEAASAVAGCSSSTITTLVNAEMSLLTGSPTITCTSVADGYVVGTTTFTYKQVTVTYQLNLIGPYSPWLTSFTLTSTARMRTEL